MKLSHKELKNIIPALDWSLENLASKLSIIGHESEVLSSDLIDVKLTSNRKDCRNINYLAFDLIAVYDELGSNNNLIKHKYGEPIKITLKKINKILGSNISKSEFKKIERLGFKVKSETVVPPDFRDDIIEGADVAEEVFRIVGSTALQIKNLTKIGAVVSKEYEYLNNIRAAMSEAGASETRTISFTRTGEIKLNNPFSLAQPFMRDTLLYGLLETVSRNPYLRRNYFYEIGNIFKPVETTKLGVIITGYKNPLQLIKQTEEKLGLNMEYSKVEEKLLEHYSIKQPNVMFIELNINDIKLTNKTKYKSSGIPPYKKISKFPPLVRDISVTTSVKDEYWLPKIREYFGNILLISELIDEYTDDNSGKMTRTYKLIFQNRKSTFTSEQIKVIDDKIVEFI